ncbi:MAG: hypothetical protein KKD18_00320 [Nanoarchaeota archaeon]|nr:hypothetical protein [Nanoarchaeota archaeon]MBU0976843.1 hypothetical protein [Nanoarchaeota archaeon]
MKVIPTIFAHNKKEFKKRFEKILPITKNIQIDFMDGKFVESKSIQLRDIPNLKKYNKNFEAHLMCLHPERYLVSLKKKGFKKILFHIKSTDQPGEIVKRIKMLKLKLFIAVNPTTTLNKIKLYTKAADGIMFMGVKPGRESQKFQVNVYQKISQFRKSNKKTIIQVDGGVNLIVAKKLSRLGVKIINTGSYISEAENPMVALMALKKALKSLD